MGGASASVCVTMRSKAPSWYKKCFSVFLLLYKLYVCIFLQLSSVAYRVILQTCCFKQFCSWPLVSSSSLCRIYCCTCAIGNKCRLLNYIDVHVVFDWHSLKGGKECLGSSLSLVWNLGCHLTPLSYPSLVFLPSLPVLSVLSFFCQWSILLTFFKKILKYFWLRVRLFCLVLFEQLGDYSWQVVCAACCHNGTGICH